MYDDQYTGAGRQDRGGAARLPGQGQVHRRSDRLPAVLSVISVTTPDKVVALTNGYAPQILKNDHKASYNFRFYPTNIEFAPR